MKKTALKKDIFREIWRTKARFMSIFSIIFLGVGFFAGIKATGPDMLKTAEYYYRDQQLMDAKVISPNGLDAKDIALLKTIPNIKDVQPTYTADVFLGKTGVLAKIYSYKKTDPLNKYVVVSGRLPQKAGELVLDASHKSDRFNVGNTLLFTHPDPAVNLAHVFRTVKFKIVGKVKHPQFISLVGRGASQIGKGTVDLFAGILEKDFKLFAPTEAYVSFRDTKDTKPYSLQYKQRVKKNEQRIVQTLSAYSSSKIYVFDRSLNPGYNEYKENADRLTSIASIFPLFFFLVAALVSLTTMTHLIEENRWQIGTLKALGYSNRDIMLKFLIYATLSSVSGALAGLAVGYQVFPHIIFNAYHTLYNLPFIRTHFYLSYSAVSITVALICTTLMTLVALQATLKSNVAQLLRPKIPQKGSRIFLERLRFIWRHLGFIAKVTARNLFRYKARMLMTVCGVAGCTALILTGFGLRDSIKEVVSLQYGRIMKADAIVTLQKNSSLIEKEAYHKLLSQTRPLKSRLQVMQIPIRALKKGKNPQEVHLFIPQKTTALENFIVLKQRTGFERLSIPSDSIIVTEKLARLFALHIGSMLTVQDPQGKVFHLKVTAVTENYFMHYIYMQPDYYRQVFAKDVVMNTELLTFQPRTQMEETKVSQQLLRNAYVNQVTLTSQVSEAFNDTLDSINIIIIVLICSAAALAFVVLYHLTNINVSERMRELSTVKVLGFHDIEVTMYIYRENTILTFFGIALGSVLGRILHRFVLQTTEVDMMMFNPSVHLMSYLVSGGLTLMFSSMVMVLIHFKLTKIDMIEALKSVE